MIKRRKKNKIHTIDDEGLTQCEKCGKEITQFEASLNNEKDWCIDCINEDLEIPLEEDNV